MIWSVIKTSWATKTRQKYGQWALQRWGAVQGARPDSDPSWVWTKVWKERKRRSKYYFSIGRAEPPINDSDKNSWRMINSLFPSPKIIHRINFIPIYLLFVFLKNNFLLWQHFKHFHNCIMNAHVPITQLWQPSTHGHLISSATPLIPSPSTPLSWSKSKTLSHFKTMSLFLTHSWVRIIAYGELWLWLTRKTLKINQYRSKDYSNTEKLRIRQYEHDF